MTSTVSEQTLEAQILEALGNDERFEVGSEKYNLFEPYLPKLLIEAIGSKLDDLVNMQTLCDVTAKLLVLIAESDCFDGLRPLEAPMARQLYISLADQLNEVVQNYEEFLHSQGITADEAMHYDSLGLNDEMTDAYDNGILTYRMLATSQPGVFVPRT